MQESGQVTAPSQTTRRPRAWWQWVLGIGLIGVAVVSIVVRLFPSLPGVLSGGGGAVARFEIKPPASLEAVGHLPIEPGALSGCNVLLVTLDTTRADRIGIYGNHVVSTPTLDRLGREGVVFSDVMAVAPVTLPSHSSILTGLYPYHHGARANNLFSLDAAHTTIAEVLRDAGYRTAAFVSAFVIAGRFGTSQGFEYFDDALEEEQKDLWLEVAERRGDETADRAINWLQGHAHEKFFAWVHFYDPHFPYRAPDEYQSDRRLPYDAEISFMDAQLNRLVAALDELKIADKTLLVVVGDHGEGLNHHDEWAHGMLVYDTVMRVPMIMKCGDRLGGGIHVTQPASQVDVMPTVLSLLGVHPPAAVDGRDLTSASDPNHAIYFETLEGLAEHGCAAFLGVRSGPHKYIYGLKPELYDVGADPFEESNLASSKKDVMERLHERLRSFFGDDLEKATTPDVTESLTAEEMAKLASLGYTVGSETIAPASERTDPRETLEVLRLVTPAVTKGTEEGLPELERIAEKYPDSYLVHLYRGQGYQRAGQYDRAEAAYERATEIREGPPQPWLGLAQVKALQGDFKSACELYDFVLTRMPNIPGVLAEYSQVLARQGRLSDAADKLAMAFELNPTDELYPDRLLRLMTRANRRADAIALFQKKLAENPALAMVRTILVAQQIGEGEYARGIELLRQGLRLDPNRPELINNLAYVLATCPDEQYRSAYEATAMQEALCQKTGYKDPRYLHTLALIYFTRNRADEAISVAEKAETIASSTSDPTLKWYLPSIRSSLEAFRKAKAEGMAPLVHPPGFAERFLGVDSVGDIKNPGDGAEDEAERDVAPTAAGGNGNAGAATQQSDDGGADAAASPTP